MSGFTDTGISFPGLFESAVAWSDYDIDGDLDLAVSGCAMGGGGLCTVGSGLTRIYQNDNGNFTDINAGLPAIWSSTMAWGDYDNDGYPDLLLTGWNEATHLAKLYHNNHGNGTFSDVPISLPGVGHGSVAWGDYNNDGLPDVLITGCAGSTCDNSFSRVYRNDGGGAFTDINAGLPSAYSSSGAWGDYDGDGNLDILLTGDAASPIARVYHNQGNNVFTDINAGLLGIQRGQGVWGDYDADGDPDILLVGCTSGLGGGTCDAYTAKVYRNDGNGIFTDINAALSGAYYATAAWADYDNDGQLDIVLAGTINGWGSANVTHIYHNNGGGAFTEIGAGLTGIWDGAVAWGDYDGDHDLDLLLTGDGGGFITKLYRNDGPPPNTPPSAPTNLGAVVQGRSATLHWEAGGDSQTLTPSLTYNVRAGIAPGGLQVISPLATSSGNRLIPQWGNVQQGLTTTLTNLWYHTTYYWGVQSIDSGFEGSPFSAEDSFTTSAPTVQFAQTTYRQKESATGAVFTVNLSGPSALTVTVDYATSNNIALAGSDYVSTTGTLMFAPGVTSQSFVVLLHEDTLIDLEESFFVTLSNSVGATLGTPDSAELTITDNDIPVQFESGEFVVSEGGDPFKPITVTLGVVPPYTVTVDYATVGGTAQAGAEYLPVNWSLTFAPGVTLTVFTVTIWDDGTYEPSEDVLVALSNPDNATLGAPMTTTLILTNDDPPPVAQFSFGPLSVNEASGNRVVGVSLNTTSGLTATVDYATYDGTALAGSDYLTATGTLTFSPGTTFRTFNVPILDDALIEESETFTATLSNPVSATLGSLNPVTLTVLDNDPVILFSSGGYSVTEGETSAVITVALNTASPVTVTVTYNTYDYTAIAGSDYLTATGSLTFTPGITALTFAVPIVDDAVGEPNEAVYLWLASPVGASLGAISSAFLTILDNEPLVTVQLSAGAYSVSETNNTATITATLNLASPMTVTVRYATANGTALAGGDYLTTTGTLTFTPGMTTLTVTIPVLADSLNEYNETFQVSLFNPTVAVIGTPAQGTVTILDDDAPPAVQFGTAMFIAPEYDRQALITATLGALSGKTVTVHYTTSDGSAQAGSDYLAVSGTLTFAAGTNAQMFTVPLINDDQDESDETFSLVLANPNNASLGEPNPSTLTLVDNDPVIPIVVTKFDDTNDGSCDGVDCSLREAVLTANTMPGDDVINLPAGVYSLTLGELGLNSDVMLVGAGPATTVVTANQTSRLFRITGDSRIVLQDMTLTGGQPGLDSGGAIYNQGSALTLINMTLANNYAFNGGGGLFTWGSAVTIMNSAVISNVAGTSGGAGILSYGNGSVDIINSTIAGNQAFGAYDGGGIWSQGILTITGSFISDNAAEFGGGIFSSGRLLASDTIFSGNSAQYGGGLELRSGATLLRDQVSGNTAAYGGGMRHLGGVLLRDSLVMNNTASVEGGGVDASVSSWFVFNTTFSGNHAGTGGAIANNLSTETTRLTLNNVTIANNSATSGVGGLAGNRADVRNTILASNTGATPNCSGPLTSQGYNLIQDMTGCVMVGDLTSNLTGVLAGLGPLQDNGGGTLTHALLLNSLAVDTGNPTMPGSGGLSCEAADQRGTVRPQNLRCDIGAYESILSGLISPSEGGSLTVTASLTTHLTFPPGAVSEPLTVTVELTRGLPVSTGFQLLGEAYVITAHNAAGETVMTFAQPFTITVDYDAAELMGLDESMLKIYFWDTDAGQWIALSTNVDTGANRLMATVDHLTVFSVLADTLRRLLIPLVLR